MMRLSTCLATAAIAGIGVGCGPVEPGEQQVAESTEAVSGTYDLAQYVVPSCSETRSYSTSGSGFRRYIPMSVVGGRGRFVYVTSTDGSNFLEFRIDSNYVRIWADTSWAHTDMSPECGGSPFCDEVCGRHQTPSPNCRCLWYHGAGSADFVYNAPRDASNQSLGERFLPRHVTVSGSNETIVPMGSTVIRAERKSSCTSCDSWHSSPPGTSQSRSMAIRHYASYNGYNDVIRARVSSGPGTGESFYFARGYGWIGFESGSYSDWITGGSSSTPNPSLSCFAFNQGSICSVTNPGGGGGSCSTSYPSGSWNACVFDGTGFNSYAGSQSWGSIDFDWQGGGPLGRSDNFSIDARRTVCFSSGTYRFYTLSDDGIRLDVNGHRVIDNWTDHAPVQNNSGLINLNGCVPMRARFYERGGGAVFKVWWAREGSGGGGSCPCSSSPGFNNFCYHGPRTTNCPMTFPGGYCDPNGDGSYSDGDWVRGYNEYQAACGN